MHTITYRLPDGREAGAIILPVTWEYRLSASRVEVSPEGKLKRPNPYGGYFIKPATYLEITSGAFREGANENKRTIIAEGSNCIARWMRKAAKHFHVLRLFYGGDPYVNENISGEFWPDLYHKVVGGYPGNELHIWTANTERLNTMGEKCMEYEDVYFISEAQSYRDLPLFCRRRVIYHWEHEDGKKIDESEVIPHKIDSPFKEERFHISIPEGAYRLWKEAGS